MNFPAPKKKDSNIGNACQAENRCDGRLRQTRRKVCHSARVGNLACIRADHLVQREGNRGRAQEDQQGEHQKRARSLAGGSQLPSWCEAAHPGLMLFNWPQKAT